MTLTVKTPSPLLCRSKVMPCSWSLLPAASLRMAGRVRPWLCLSCYRRPAGTDFSLSGLSRGLPAACAISFAHGFVGYAGVPLALLHFVARRRLPAVKRSAALAGVASCEIKTVPPAALRIHSAATRRTPCRVPSSFLLHSAGRTPPRQTRCAGLPIKGHIPVSSLRSGAHCRAGVNSPLRVEL
jgi:hypothetical protein